MLVITGAELAALPGQHIDRQVIDLLCEQCRESVAWVSLRELAGIVDQADPVICFRCEENGRDKPSLFRKP